MELTEQDQKQLEAIKAEVEEFKKTFESLPDANDEKEFAIQLNNTQRLMSKFRNDINKLKALHPAKGKGYRRRS